MKSFTRKRALGAAAIAGVAALMLSACGAAPEDNAGGSDAPDSDFLACAVSDEGSWNDKSFNEAAYGGLEMAKDELGIEINDAESGSPEDFAPFSKPFMKTVTASISMPPYVPTVLVVEYAAAR